MKQNNQYHAWLNSDKFSASLLSEKDTQAFHFKISVQDTGQKHGKGNMIG